MEITSDPSMAMTPALNPNKLLLELQIQIMQAAFAGKSIECRARCARGEEWTRVVNPSWNWDRFEYRIAPPPLAERWALYSEYGNFRSTYETEVAAKDGNSMFYNGRGRVILLREVR